MQLLNYSTFGEDFIARGRGSSLHRGRIHFRSNRPFIAWINSHQACPLSITWVKACSMSPGSLIVQPRHVHSVAAASSPGKINACIRCHIGTAGRVQLRQYFRLVSLGASLRLEAGNSFWGRRGVRMVPWNVSAFVRHIYCECVCTSSDYPERTRSSLLRETPHKAAN